MIKIYVFFGLIIVSLLSYVFILKSENKALQIDLNLAVNVNKDLNLTLTKTLQRNELEKEILRQKHEEDLKILTKTKDALNYVRKSKETNNTKLFNDSIKLLQ